VSPRVAGRRDGEKAGRHFPGAAAVENHFGARLR
jgi:hypothetical protein